MGGWELTGVVLAGGKSRRLHQDKTQLVLPPQFGATAGLTLLELVIDRLAQVCDEVLVVGGSHGRGRLTGAARVLDDLVPDKGALGGLYTGLLTAHNPYALVVACDMPFLSVPLLRYMASLPRDFDVLLPRVGEHVEPLHAIYGRTCVPYIERVLAEGGMRIIEFFGDVRVRQVEEQQWRAYDPRGLSFFNINTPEDLRRARALTRNSGGEPASSETT